MNVHFSPDLNILSMKNNILLLAGVGGPAQVARIQGWVRVLRANVIFRDGHLLVNALTSGNLSASTVLMKGIYLGKF